MRKKDYLIIFSPIIIFLVVMFVGTKSWESEPIDAYYRNQFRLELEGIIHKSTLHRGCGIHLELYDRNRTYLSFKKDSNSIFLNGHCDIKDDFKKRYYFKKIANSNKCMILKGDSILKFNCNKEYYLEEYIDKSTLKTSQWKLDEINKWEFIAEELKNIYFQSEKYKEFILKNK